MPRSDMPDVGQMVELDIDRVHELAKRMAFHIPEGHTVAEIKAAVLMIWMGTMPHGKLQDVTTNQQFLLLASKELVKLGDALYGSAPQT